MPPSPAVTTIDASDVERRLGTIARDVRDTHRRLLVQRHGKPAFAMVPVADLERLLLLDTLQQRGLGFLPASLSTASAIPA